METGRKVYGAILSHQLIGVRGLHAGRTVTWPVRAWDAKKKKKLLEPHFFLLSMSACATACVPSELWISFLKKDRKRKRVGPGVTSVDDMENTFDSYMTWRAGGGRRGGAGIFLLPPRLPFFFTTPAGRCETCGTPTIRDVGVRASSHHTYYGTWKLGGQLYVRPATACCVHLYLHYDGPTAT